MTGDLANSEVLSAADLDLLRLSITRIGVTLEIANA